MPPSASSPTPATPSWWKAHIPHRLAPATKLAQVLYNHRLVQRRSRSQKPEYEYNLDRCAASSPTSIRPWWSRRAPTCDPASLQQVREQVAARLEAGMPAAPG